MHYHAKARKNMVQCQLAVNGVQNNSLLEAFLVTARESFLPLEYQHLAYADATIDLGACQTFLSPVIQGRMAQEACVGPVDSIVVMGCPTGYMAAVLSHLAQLVVYVAETEEGKRRAAEKFYALKCDNVVSEDRQSFKKSFVSETFDTILYFACLSAPPKDILNKLSPKGSIFYIQHGQCPKVMTVVNSDGCFTKQELFDVFLPCAILQHEKQFVF